MSEALIGGLRQAGVAGERIRVANPTAAKRERLQQRYGIVGYPHGAEAMVGADVVVLSVKPQIMRSVLAEIPIARGTTVVSVAAGLKHQHRRICSRGREELDQILLDLAEAAAEPWAELLSGAAATPWDEGSPPGT